MPHPAGSHPSGLPRLQDMSTREMTRTHSMIDSPIGQLTLVAQDDGLAGVYMEQHRRRPAEDLLGEGVDSGFEQVAQQLGEYFAGTRTAFDLVLRPHGN